MQNGSLNSIVNRTALSTFKRMRTEKVNKEPREDFSLFMREVMRDRKGSALEDNYFSRAFDVIVPWCHKNGHNLSMAGAPGTGKSTRARGYLLFALGQDPLSRIVIAGGTESLGGHIVASMRSDVSKRTGRYRKIFPEIQLDDTKLRDFTQMGNTKDCFFLKNAGGDPSPSCEAVAPEPTGEQRRVDIGLFDDFMGRLIAESSKSRARRFGAFKDTWLNGRLKNPEGDGWAFAIQNVYHKQDMAHQLINHEQFISVWFGINETCDALF